MSFLKVIYRIPLKFCGSCVFAFFAFLFSWLLGLSLACYIDPAKWAPGALRIFVDTD